MHRKIGRWSLKLINDANTMYQRLASIYKLHTAIINITNIILIYVSVIQKKSEVYKSLQNVGAVMTKMALGKSGNNFDVYDTAAARKFFLISLINCFLINNYNGLVSTVVNKSVKLFTSQ